MRILLFLTALFCVGCPDIVVHYTPPAGDDSVVALRNVEIPNLPGRAVAYNASIIKHRGRFVMAFRMDRPTGDGVGMQIAVVGMNDDFSVTDSYSILETRRLPTYGWTAEDPRLFSVGDVLYVVFNTTLDGEKDSPRHIHIGRLGEHGGMYELGPFAELLLPRAGETRHIEKNWTPFVYNNEIHLVHTTNPPRVVKVPTLGLELGAPTLVVDNVALSSREVLYYFGRMRGGTPAVLDDRLDSYVSVFHSSVTADLGQGAKEYYFMGLYTFAKEPPFNIEAVAPYPILASTLYGEDLSRHIAFPQGLIIEDDIIHVSFGRNDNSIGVATLDKDKAVQLLRAAEEVN